MVLGVADPSARIRVQLVPLASPARCGICGKSEHPDGFVDPQLDFEFYGSLIFCPDCIIQMARVYQMIKLEEYKELSNRLDKSIANGLKLSAKIQEMEKIIDGFSSSWLNRNNQSESTFVPIITPVSEASSESVGDKPKFEPEFGPIIKPAEPGKSTTAKSPSFDRLLHI